MTVRHAFETQFILLDQCKKKKQHTTCTVCVDEIASTGVYSKITRMLLKVKGTVIFYITAGVTTSNKSSVICTV